MMDQNGNLQRHRATRLAHTDTAGAVAAARAMADPWYACQSLAWAARYGPDDQFAAIIKESLRVCRKEVDPYRIVAPAAWPVRAMVERDRLELLPAMIPGLLERSKEIELLVSRSEALFLLFQAVFPAGLDHWFPIFESLLEASNPLISWRQRRNLGDAILIISSEDEALAQERIEGLTDPKLKTKIGKMLPASTPYLPRTFFWEVEALRP